jgi:hypothetical protein
MKTFFMKFGWSISDRRFGVQVVGEETHETIKYLLILMLVFGSVVMTKATYGILYGMDQLSDNFNMDMPNFEIKDGKFSCDLDTPYVKIARDMIYIIDVTGKVKADTLDGYATGVFIDKTAWTYKRNATETTRREWTMFKNYNFTKSQLINFIANFKYPMLVLIFILGMAFIFVFKLIGVFIVSLIALLMNAIMKTDIEYADLFKLSVYAVALPTILDKGLDLFGVVIPYFFVLYYIIAAFFLYRYLNSFKEEY